MASIVFRVLSRKTCSSLRSMTSVEARSLSIFTPTTSTIINKPTFAFDSLPSEKKRNYSTKQPFPWEPVVPTEVRVLNVCKAFDKINADILTITSHFMNDLGLDSLDHVELIMAAEDEFGFEIPDFDAEKLMTVEALLRYVEDKIDDGQDAFEDFTQYSAQDVDRANDPKAKPEWGEYEKK